MAYHNDSMINASTSSLHDLVTTLSPYRQRSSFSIIKILPIYIPIAALCFIGNTLVCVTIFRSARMKNRCFYILANLAISDIGFALATPLQLLQYSNVRLGTAGCKSTIFTVDLFFGSAVLSLAAVSYDRYRGICSSKFVRAKDGGYKLGNFLILFIWLGAGAVYSPMLFSCRANSNPKKLVCDCYSFWSKEYHYTIYAGVIVLCTYVLPMITMLYCYSHILWTIYKSKEEAPQARGGADNKKKVIKMLIAATLLFMICWLPYNILYMLKKFNAISGKLLGKIFLLSQVIGFTNSACNPFVYCIFSKNFRRGFKEAILCRRRGLPFSSNKYKNSSPCSRERILKPRANTDKSYVEGNSDIGKPRCFVIKESSDTGYQSS